MHKWFKLKKLISLFLILCIILTIIPPTEVKAAPFNVEEKKVDNIWTYKIIFEAIKASSSIRFETVGFKFTTSKVPSTASVNGMSGPGSVPENNIIMFGEGGVVKSPDETIGNIVKTTVTFTEDDVVTAFGNKTAEELSKETIYTHAIFKTYEWVNGNKVYRDDNKYYSWEAIARAEGWSISAIENFKSYYNMDLGITIEPKLQQSTLHYVTEFNDEPLKPSIPLEAKKENEMVSWSGEAKLTSSLSGKPKVYDLIGFRVTKRTGNNAVTDSKKVEQGGNLTGIVSGSTKVFAEGMDIFLLYRESKEALQPNTLHYVTETGAKLQDFTSLEKKPVNAFVTWSGSAQLTANITGANKVYELIGYYVKKKVDSSIADSKYVSSGASLSSIQNGKTKVYEGGMAVFLVYKVSDFPPGGGETTPSPGLEPRPIDVPVPETISESIISPLSTGIIRADNRTGEKFLVDQGVPTTESLYTQVNTDEFLLGYNLTKKVGIESYTVKVSKDYILKWKGANASGVINLTETKTVVKYVTINRAYGYWEIINFDLFKIGSAKIDNYALPNGSVTMVPDYGAGYNPPSASTTHSSSKADHIIIPAEIKNGVKLPSQTITGDKIKPTIPLENFELIVDNQIPDLTVKNDHLVVDGVVVMDSTPTLLEGPRIKDLYISEVRADGVVQCNDNVMYKPDQVIEATKKNGTYHSTGMLEYVRVESVNTKYPANIPSLIYNLESVVIHTPVYCNPVVAANNDENVQLINPSNATQLVLDSNSSLNDFTVMISNFGQHSYKPGYYSRDFSRSLRDPNISYIATSNGHLRNELKFPFDVYMKQASGDVFVKKNTWIVIGRSTVTFYLPMWVQEGIYTVACRSIAVNADFNNLDQISEKTKNTKLFNYVATDTFKVEVSGRVYGLSIYDLTDYPIWEEVFRVKDSLELKINDKTKYPDGTNKTTYSKDYSYNYTVGTNDQYGNDTTRNVKYTFPLVNNSHPLYKNVGVLKTGYAVRFKLNTIGTMYSSSSAIFIKPTFYYVDADGKNRIPVDLYYEESIHGKNEKLVKMGSALDQINLKKMQVGSPLTGISKVEMKNTASILGMNYQTYLSQDDVIFNFKDIRMISTFRTFVNSEYTKSIIATDQYSKIKATGITQADMMKQMQTWYGSYYIPGIVHVAPLGYDVYGHAAKYGVRFNEEFWKRDGYIIVNFDIVTRDSDGNERLSYINGNDNMWQREGAPVSKKDNENVNFNFAYGDFIIYYTDKSVHDDYSVGGLY